MSALNLVMGQVTAALHEAEASGNRGSLSLWFVTLTFAPGELDEVWPWQCADLYAEAIKREGHPSGALLALDVSAADRRHWHGLVISRRDQLALDRVWRGGSGHCPRGDQLHRRVTPVTGAAGPWPNPLLAANVRRILSYVDRANDWPRDVPKPALHDRVIASGIFAGYIDTAEPPVDAPCPTFLPVIARRLHARLHRRCEVCRVPLPPAGRSHRRTCSRRCRVRKHREDRALAAAGQ